MPLPLSVLEGVLKAGLREHPRLLDHLGMRAQLIDAALEKDPAGRKIHHSISWKGPSGYKWNCVVDMTDRARPQFFTLLPWLHWRKGEEEREALDALCVRTEGRSLHFDSHFFARYKRYSGLRDLVMNMHEYHRYNHRITPRILDSLHHGWPAVAGAVKHGLVLGRSHGEHLISCDTFIPFDMMRDDQRELWQEIAGRKVPV